MARKEESMMNGDTKLTAFRARIDAIDDQLIALMRERIGVVHEVAAHKRATASKAQHFMRPGREADMLRRLQHADFGDFPYSAAAMIWRMLICGSLAVEDPLSVSACAPDGDMTFYWLAREYFGAFTPIATQPVAGRVIGDILDGRAVIGALPPPQLPPPAGAPAWWLSLAFTTAEKRPRVFAVAPFIPPVSPNERQTVFIGRVLPEDSGDDTTLLVVELAGPASRALFGDRFTQAGLEAVCIAEAPAPHDASHPCYLFRVTGFVDESSPAFPALTEAFGAILVQCCILGSYANPVTLSF